jgi:Ankyrin repeats (3 copies)
MKKKIKIIGFVFFIICCSCNFDKQGNEFENFDNTPLEELANAVSDNDVEEIREILKSNKIDIDFKEPKWQQTLLTTAIVNKKREAFIELLKFGANPNALIGNYYESTPLNEAIRERTNDDLFYIEYLLQHGANPNLLVTPTNGFAYYILFTALEDNKSDSDNNLTIIKLLIKYGADINCCDPTPMNDGNCEGVIYQCLESNRMNFLRFFVIEKKMKTPKFAYGTSGDGSQKKYTLTQILNTEDFKFEDFKDELGKIDFSEQRKVRNEILDYLKKTGQE